MPDNLVTVTFPVDTGILSDYTVNTWSFFTAQGKTESEMDLVKAALTAFYTGFDQYLSHLLTGTPIMRAYDRSDPSPRVPWYQEAMAIVPPTAGQPMPEEVAYCLSFSAQQVSGVNMARRRGRVFLGPFNAGALGSDGRPAPEVRDAVRGGAGTLLADSLSAPEWTWQVWSSADNAGREVQSGWVDNAWDTQRRRGREATSRVAFPG